MARRSGGTHKGVEEKRRMLPIYQHYTLSPGKTKSHHPEAKCNHCHREFVCGSKQRLIRHLRKCNSISNSDQIIAETLNTLARNSATGQLNHSILEASNLLPSQIPHINHHLTTTQQHIGQHNPNVTTTTSNIHHNTSATHANNHSGQNTSGSSSLNNSGSSGLVASTSNGSVVDAMPVKKQRRGRKPGNQNSTSGIQVTTGLDGKTHFTPVAQMPQNVQGTVANNPLITHVHNGRNGSLSYAYQSPVSTPVSATSIAVPGNHLIQTNSGHIHTNHQSTPLNSESIDKAYLKLVLTRNLPLSLCDTKEFQLWLKTFAIDYKPPSSINLIGQNLKNEAQFARQRISNILVKASKKTVSLELHLWPDEYRSLSRFAVIAGIDHKRFLISVKDAPTYVNRGGNNPSDYTFQTELIEFIDECVKRVGSDRVNSLMFSSTEKDSTILERIRQPLYMAHPSVVAHNCWWHFTNLLCSDIIESSEKFRNVVRDSRTLVSHICKQSRNQTDLERFSPFAGVSGSLRPKKSDTRWYAHLICYLLEFMKNNNEAILKLAETEAEIRTQSLSDNNNNSAVSGSSQTRPLNAPRPEIQQDIFLIDTHLDEVKLIITSAEYWDNLFSLLNLLKPMREILNLNPSNPQPPPGNHEDQAPLTPTISPTHANNLSLGDYMNWFIRYGKLLFDSWNQSPNHYKYNLIGQYLNRFSSCVNDFKLLFAAYLLNPRHRCAFVTQEAKDSAIEEILNIASEFMPEESDGHTIFDQWKLFLVREEPYDVAFDESKSSPLEWWMSLPCAESIRRVALRILRLRAFTSPRSETVFSQLYFYEDETGTALSRSSFEDVAILRFFYDYEDKVAFTPSHNHIGNVNHSHNTSSQFNPQPERALVGYVHNSDQHEFDSPNKFLPTGAIETSESNGRLIESINDVKQDFSNSYNNLDTYMNHAHPHLEIANSQLDESAMSLENLSGYSKFATYIDFNQTGVQIVEEPVGKKRRKWTAQEILSKQANLGDNRDIETRK